MEGKAWNYDPYHAISNLRVSISSARYIYHVDSDIQRLENNENWTEVQEVLQG